MKYVVSIILGLAGLVYGHGDHAHSETKAGHMGNAEFHYYMEPNWGRDSGEFMGPMHGGVVVDKRGLVYVSTDGPESMYVFSPEGELLKKMAKEARGIHHMLIREENGQEFIYGAQLNAFNERIERMVKLNLDGEIVFQIPNEKTGEVPQGFNGMSGVAVAPNGDIFCSLGYGGDVVHKFDAEGRWLKTIGGKGSGVGEFKVPHTMAIDPRFGEARLLVCDRENGRLQHFDLDGNFIQIYKSGLRRPGTVVVFGDLIAVAELRGRISILNKAGDIVAELGDKENKHQWAKLDTKPHELKQGSFASPHGLAIDSAGNFYVQEWSRVGRISKLKKLSK